MPRRRRVTVREVLPDPVYNNRLVTQLVNKILLDGKRSVAERTVYDAFALIEKHFSPQMESDVVKNLVNETYFKALIDEDKFPLSTMS